MKDINIPVIELTLAPKEAKVQLNSMIKNNLSHFSSENFGVCERTGHQSKAFLNAIEKLKEKQKGILEQLEHLTPDQKVNINCQITLQIK